MIGQKIRSGVLGRRDRHFSDTEQQRELSEGEVQFGFALGLSGFGFSSLGLSSLGLSRVGLSTIP
jgi:hypothetical protein